MLPEANGPRTQMLSTHRVNVASRLRSFCNTTSTPGAPPWRTAPFGPGIVASEGRYLGAWL
eukprot:11161531-Lingulodinium_polyedra.AAC.1